MNQTALIENVVKQVLDQLKSSGASAASAPAPAAPSAPVEPADPSAGPQALGARNAFGIYENVDDAVKAATESQAQLMGKGLATRDQICKMLAQVADDRADEWGLVELKETKVGRLDHKIAKLKLLQKVPGVNFLRTPAHTGDNGIALDEGAPWGVIGCVTPVTHSIPTLTANAINMIAAGNALVINAHPSGYQCAKMAVEVYNRCIAEICGVENMICLIDPPTLRSAEEIFRHEAIPLLVVTGGPAVARAAMKQNKRAIVAGPGNPPVVVDETADLDNAARSIIAGGSFDNNLLCIGEKEVFVVDAVFDKMMDAMARAGAKRLNSTQVDKLTKAAFTWKDDHFAVNKDLVGAGCKKLAEAAGTTCGPAVDLLYGETDESNPFVPEEQMMPFVPFVRARDFDHALTMAVRHEHGFGHTAMIHSNNLANITRMGRVMNTTIFVVNGPCTAGLGVGGEGYPSYSIATPTGEGITNPLTFTRFRRMSISGSLRIV